MKLIFKSWILRSYRIKKLKNYYPTFHTKKRNEFIKEDIILAHNLFKNKLKIDLKGFRAPHFGEISQKKGRSSYLNDIYILHLQYILLFKWTNF